MSFPLFISDPASVAVTQADSSLAYSPMTPKKQDVWSWQETEGLPSFSLERGSGSDQHNVDGEMISSMSPWVLSLEVIFLQFRGLSLS
jgi:hypothetical protein